MDENGALALEVAIVKHLEEMLGHAVPVVTPLKSPMRSDPEESVG